MFEELKKIELTEELFGTDFPADLTEELTLNNPREVVDYFVLCLRGWGPNPAAADFLKKLAKKHNSPALAEGLHDRWRRDQISAFIREIFNTGPTWWRRCGNSSQKTTWPKGWRSCCCSESRRGQSIWSFLT